MAAVLLTLVVCLLSFSSTDGQGIKKDNTNANDLTGPESFVTDGTRELSLTCGSGASDRNGYVWFFAGSDNLICSSGQEKNVCKFRPRLQDDQENVTCRIVPEDGDATRHTYEVNLKFPPQSKPTITIQPSTKEPLKNGDVITCTVTGGKPRVTSVTFYCQNPDHTDQRDVVSEYGRSVRSSITVNTSKATEQDMECTCNANWGPEPELYQDKISRSFQLEYKAKVTQFTVNATNQFTVKETSHSTVVFKCQGAGRPYSVLRLYKQDNNTILGQYRVTADMQQLFHPIDNVSQEDMGSYRCEANNTFPSPNHAHVSLLVESAPRIIGSYNYSNPSTLPPEGLTFEMVAFPTPEFKESYFLGNGTMTTRNLAQKNTFETKFTRKTPLGHLVECHVTPQNVPEDKLGLYEMYVNNKLKTTSFRFRVDKPAHLRQDDELPTTAITLGMIPVVIIGIIVIIVYGLGRRTHNTDQTKHHASNINNDHTGRSKPVTLTMPTTPTTHNLQGVVIAANDEDTTKDGSSSMSILSDGDYTTVGERVETDYRPTDSNVYDVVGGATSCREQDIYNHLHGDTVPPTDSMTYSHLDADSRGPQQEGSADSATPNSTASRPDQATDTIIGPKGDVYAVVAPKQKGDNLPHTDEV